MTSSHGVSPACPAKTTDWIGWISDELRRTVPQRRVFYFDQRIAEYFCVRRGWLHVRRFDAAPCWLYLHRDRIRVGARVALARVRDILSCDDRWHIGIGRDLERFHRARLVVRSDCRFGLVERCGFVSGTLARCSNAFEQELSIRDSAALRWSPTFGIRSEHPLRAYSV